MQKPEGSWFLERLPFSTFSLLFSLFTCRERRTENGERRTDSPLEKKKSTTINYIDGVRGLLSKSPTFLLVSCDDHAVNWIEDHELPVEAYRLGISSDTFGKNYFLTES